MKVWLVKQKHNKKTVFLTVGGRGGDRLCLSRGKTQIMLMKGQSFLGLIFGALTHRMLINLGFFVPEVIGDSQI